ncbi:MAG: hypothetical protein KAS18_04450 [Calditrichia bacterium]|nr:hypothetical protein [Calditrichia bacterium]
MLTNIHLSSILEISRVSRQLLKTAQSRYIGLQPQEIYNEENYKNNLEFELFFSKSYEGTVLKYIYIN